MFKQFALAAVATTALFAAPASAAVVCGPINPDTDADTQCNITLLPVSPGAVASAISFDVNAAGAFTAVFEFFNPFNPAAAGASATFDFDPDIVTFTGGDISGGGVATPMLGAVGNSIQINRAGLAMGANTLTIMGTLTTGATTGANSFARIGGQLNLTGAIPEPTTWALFILGFGAIGYSMRRRSAKVRMAKASLNFA